MPDPPDPLGDDEWAAASGLAAVSPSPEVEAALRNANERTREFEIAVASVQFEERTGRTLSETGKSARLELDEARQGAIAAISDAERIMRDELTAL